MTNIQVEMVISALLLLLIIIGSLKHNSLSIKNSVTWLLLPVVFILIAIFPEPLTKLAHWLGFETLANFIFLTTIALLIMLCFTLAVTISHQQSQIAKLTQEISIMKRSINIKNKKHKN